MKHASLQAKLTARLCVVLVILGLIFTASLNHSLRTLLETEVEDKARLVFSNVLAVQSYVRDTLRPAMFDNLAPGAFVIEAMSTSYVTRKVMSDLNLSRDQFVYRRVALDPRNPEFAANAMEQELIARFAAQSGLASFNSYREMEGREVFISARPVVFEARCLSCHGEPGDAPAVMLARYGGTRGFGRQAGEVGGLDLLIMPLETEAAAIQRSTFTFVLVFAVGTVLVLGINHFFFDRITAHNIGRLAALLRVRFPDEAGRTLDLRPGDDIEGMVKDMERFADHLRAAKEQLADYAANLEARVAERTAELSREAAARQADVALFVQILARFAEGSDRRSLLHSALEAVTARFAARSATFHCFMSLTSYPWPLDAPSLELDAAQRGAVLAGNFLDLDRAFVVPVQAADSVRGALALAWDPGRELSPAEREVLLALGRQLGLALENLEALESLLRQKAVLESMFEGIADPIFLVDGAGSGGGVRHANPAGRRLLEGLPAGGLDLAGLAAEAQASGRIALERQASLAGDRTLTLRAYPLAGHAGAIVFVRDITVEKAVQERLTQGEKALAVGQLAAGLAHEINNPLGVILCYARLLHDDGKSPLAPDLEIIIRHTQQAQKVLQDLLRFARPKPTEPGAVNLAEAAGFLARVFAAPAAKVGVDIATDIPADLPLVQGDPAAVEQIVTNIVLNSLDALQEPGAARPGRVSIAARHDREHGQVVLTLADNGPGIPEENLTRVFDPFFTTKEPGKGTGLGLSVAFGLARDLGGRLEVENRGGAVFTLRLPVSGESHA